MRSAVFFDLEYTAWEGSMAARWLRPGEFREVVQIGAVKVDAQTIEPLEEFTVLTRPRINTALSPYFESLTGITNAMLAGQAADFADAYARFVAFAGDGPIVSYGRDDAVLQSNLALYAIRDAKPLPRAMNIAHWLKQNGIDLRGLHACDIAKACGANFEGREHDALEDARSLVAGARALIGRGARNLFGEAG